jgi:hypothetical protein
MDNLQWFKFSPADWFMGRIQRCSEVTQARFIRLCCLYWNKECVLSEEDANVEVGEEQLNELLKLRIIDVENGMIYIKFLHDQFEECLELGNKRSKAAKARWNKQKNSKSMQLHTGEVQDYADKNRKDKNRKEENRKEESNKNSPTESSDNVDALDATPTDTPKDVCKNNKRPTIDLVIDYFVKNGYSKKAAVAAFEYYEAGTEPGQIYWRDSKGNEVRSWKQKMRGVWFKEENKVDKAIPIVEPGWKYVGLSEAYDIIRDQNSVSLSEKEAIGAGDDYVRKMMNINPSYKNVGKGWKYRENR